MDEYKNNEKDENINNTEDHLMNFMSGDTSETPTFIDQPEINKRVKVDKIEIDTDWVNIPIDELPYAQFYKEGARLSIRPVSTKELQAFAIIDEKNPYDVQLKLNEILQACTKLEYIDGSTANYKELMEGDRDTIIILISKLSAKSLKKLEQQKACNCSPDNKQSIEYIPANYVYKKPEDEIEKYFNIQEKVYIFPVTIDNVDYDIKLAPPTIGLAESMNTYVLYKSAKSQGKIKPNISFMQCVPYMKAGEHVKEMTIKQLEQEEYNFGQLHPDYFTFIYDTILLLSFGVEKVQIKCSNCRKELSVPFTFPNGPKSLFIVSNTFKRFIRQ
jgi:hypothetical protein